jgi:predicted PurR-regulated permease PerM
MIKSKPYTFDRVVRIFIGLAVFFLLFLLLKRLSGVLLPFMVAWLIAYLLQPLVSFFQYKLKFKNRALSIFSTFLLLAAIITGLVILLIPLISSEIQRMFELISLYVQGVNINSILPHSWQLEIRNYLSHLDIKSVLQNDNIMELIKKVAPQLWNIINGSLSLLLGFTVIILVFLYLIFILKDYEKVTKGMFEIIPPKYKGIVSEIMKDIEVGMNRYFRGQSLVALIVGILFAIGFSIIGLPLAIVFGLFIGVLNLVPYLQVMGIIPAFLLALLQSAQTGQNYWSIILGLLLVFIVVQSIQDILLVPKIMGRVTGLNPAVILLSLSIWGSLMGMIGLIIALPFTTLIISYYKRFVLNEQGFTETKKEIEKEAEEIAPNP